MMELSDLTKPLTEEELKTLGDVTLMLQQRMFSKPFVEQIMSIEKAEPSSKELNLLDDPDEKWAKNERERCAQYILGVYWDRCDLRKNHAGHNDSSGCKIKSKL